MMMVADYKEPHSTDRQHIQSPNIRLQTVNPNKMNSFTALLTVAMVTLAVAEPPSPYSYSRPSGGSLGGGFGGFQHSSFGGGGGGGFHSISGGGGGFQSNEGASVDPQLLEQVRQILLREESQSSSGGGGGSIGVPSGSYGVPSSSYGVPHHQQSRVVAIQLEQTIPSIQVAQFSQQSYASQPSSQYGAPAPAPHYSAPSQQYGTPQGPY